MSSAKITLFTFANYLNQHNDDLFKLLTVPSGIDKDVLTENILLRGGEFEVLYSDPIFMQNAIGTWSKKWQRTMQKWIDALSIDYNPLENYDRYEQWEDKENRKNEQERLLNHSDNRTLDYSDDRTINNSDNRTLDYSDDRTIDTHNNMLRNLRDAEDRNLQDKETRDYSDTTSYDKTIITEKEVSAYDSSTYQPSERTTETDSNGNNVKVDADGTDTFDHTGTDIFNHTGTENVSNVGTDNVKHSGSDNVAHTGTDNVKHSGSDNMAHTGTIKDNGLEDNTNNRTGHVHGNIGVTTSQQMLEAELSLDEWNIYEHITDLFLTEFIIPIYT